MEINVGCKLHYNASVETDFVFQIEAAKLDGQQIVDEQLTLPKLERGYETSTDAASGNRKIRLTAGPGAIEVGYSATIQVNAEPFDAGNVAQFAFSKLPMDQLVYLAPSRYCPSDTFTEFARATFAQSAPGYSRVVAISDWINKHIFYQAGSTGPSSSAADVFKAGSGVCRDFAHLGVALCRASGIPARYASVYAVDLNPQDFHAVFQAYLDGPDGGEWFSFDPTRMSSVNSVVRIAVGRDAADVAFSWPQAEVTFDPPQVWAAAAAPKTASQTANSSA